MFPLFGKPFAMDPGLFVRQVPPNVAELVASMAYTIPPGLYLSFILDGRELSATGVRLERPVDEAIPFEAWFIIGPTERKIFGWFCRWQNQDDLPNFLKQKRLC